MPSANQTERFVTKSRTFDSKVVKTATTTVGEDGTPWTTVKQTETQHMRYNQVPVDVPGHKKKPRTTRTSRMNAARRAAQRTLACYSGAKPNGHVGKPSEPTAVQGPLPDMAHPKPEVKLEDPLANLRANAKLHWKGPKPAKSVSLKRQWRPETTAKVMEALATIQAEDAEYLQKGAKAKAKTILPPVKIEGWTAGFEAKPKKSLSYM